MKGVILAAGKGTRMRELTNELPKPMLKVHGKPILEHIIEGLVSVGIVEIFIITGFKAETIEGYFGDGSKWNCQIAYGRQIVQDGTGKAPELAKKIVGDSPFLLTYGDILVKPETYGQMLDRYSKGDFSGVITVTGSQDVTKGGLVFFDEQFCLKRLVEKPSAEQIETLRHDGWLKPGDTAWYNAGIYIFQPSVFEFTARLQKSPRGEYELTDALSAMVEHEKTIAGMQIEGRWVDVRDPEVLAKLEAESNAVRLFYTGPVVNTEMLIAMLEKHGIQGTQEFVDPGLPDDGDLNRQAKVFVSEADYDHAHRLFYTEREDEL